MPHSPLRDRWSKTSPPGFLGKALLGPMRDRDATVLRPLAGEGDNRTDLFGCIRRWRSWTWCISKTGLNRGNRLGLQPTAAPALHHIPCQMKRPRGLSYPLALRRGQDEFGTRYQMLRITAFTYDLFQCLSFRGGEHNVGGR